MQTHQSQRGSIIIYTMMTVAAMLAIGITLTGVFISRLKRSRAAQDTIIAVYAADSAVEHCLYEARTGVAGPLTLTSGATYVIASGSTDLTASCTALSAGTFDFRATGTYRGVSRALEVSQ